MENETQANYKGILKGISIIIVKNLLEHCNKPNDDSEPKLPGS